MVDRAISPPIEAPTEVVDDGSHNESSESTYVATPTTAVEAPEGLVMIRAEDVHVKYRVYQDVKRSLKSQIKQLGRGRRYREIHAVKGITFDAHAGEAIGIIGANGSGKSTLMRAIAGLLPVNDGAVYARATPMLLGVGAVLNKGLSGRRNIMLGGLALGLTREEVLEREKEIIKFADIGDSIDLPMNTYSSGMGARLQFAISAAVRPEILIIDEALSVGDKDFKKKSQDKIEELRDSAGVVFLVTHAMGSVRQTCNRTMWLHGGNLMMDGETEEVIDAYLNSDLVGKKSKSNIAKKKRRLLREKKRDERKLLKLQREEGINLPPGSISRQMKEKMKEKEREESAVKDEEEAPTAAEEGSEPT